MKKLILIFLGAVLAVGGGIALSVAKGPAPARPSVPYTSQIQEDKDLASIHETHVIKDAIPGLMGMLLLGAIGVIYFLPSIYAYQTKHPKRDVVLLINMLTGWTVIGWIAAMVFAATKPQGGLENEIRALDSLRKSGSITEEEYAAKRTRLLS